MRRLFDPRGERGPAIHVEGEPAYAATQDRLIEPAFIQRGISTSLRHLDRDGKRRTRRILEQCHWLRRTGNGAGLRGKSSHNMWQVMQAYVKDGKYTGKRDWVALVNGNRRVPTGRNLTQNWYKYQLCTSNPEVVDIVVGSVDAFFAAKPDYDICGIGMNDGGGFCECERCQALDAPGSDSLTDRICTFYREVGNRVAPRHPGKYVGGYVYATYVDLPKRVRALPDNLLLTYVTNGSVFYDEAARAEALTRFRAWCDFHPHLQFYAWPVSHGFFGLPTVDTAWVRELFRIMRETGVLGIRNLTMGSLTAKQPDAYLYASLLGDPSLDASVLLDEYYARLFGPAADPMRSYHGLIQRQIRTVSEALELGRDVSDDAIADHENRIFRIYGPILSDCRRLLSEASGVTVDPTMQKRIEVFSNNFRLVEMMHEAIVLGRKVYAEEEGAEDDRTALNTLRKTYHEFLRVHGYTDVLDIRSISYVPSHTMGNLKPYLLIPHDLDKWHRVPVSRRPSSAYSAIGLIYREPAEALDGKTLMQLPLQWAFRTDPEDDGERLGWAGLEPNDGWAPIRTDASWTEQGHEDYHGTAWYSVPVQVPGFEVGKPVWLLFRAVDGQAWVWIDGKLVGKQVAEPAQMWNRSWALDVTDGIRPGTRHRVTVRVRKDINAAGIWKPVELRLAR